MRTLVTIFLSCAFMQFAHAVNPWDVKPSVAGTAKNFDRDLGNRLAECLKNAGIRDTGDPANINPEAQAVHDKCLKQAANKPKPKVPVEEKSETAPEAKTDAKAEEKVATPVEVTPVLEQKVVAEVPATVPAAVAETTPVKEPVSEGPKADLYYYKDDKGTIVVVNSETVVPKKFRKRLKKMSR